MTNLVYMEDFGITQCGARVVSVGEHEGKTVIVLDQTCFYPKGGGQDCDQGRIIYADSGFAVEAVFFVDGEVKHIGEYTRGQLKSGDKVECRVDEERRRLNTRLHSAGHVLDMAVRRLGWSWSPKKGAHYPHMSFVEYAGELDAANKQQLMGDLQEKVDALIAEGSTNTVQFMTPEEMKSEGAVVPENLPAGKPSRAVKYNEFIVPCGGTHVRNINEIGSVKITKIKLKDGDIRVSYSLM